jgi:NO-binding membrane sensor protein with MHYT domain
MTFLPGLFSLIPHLIVLIAAIQYVSKRSSPEGILITIGAAIGLLSSSVYTVGLPLLNSMNANGMEFYQSYWVIVSVVGTLGSFAFAIGLLLLVRKAIANP